MSIDASTVEFICTECHCRSFAREVVYLSESSVMIDLLPACSHLDGWRMLDIDDVHRNDSVMPPTFVLIGPIAPHRDRARCAGIGSTTGRRCRNDAQAGSIFCQWHLGQSVPEQGTLV